jgi:hypothetical protein
LLTLQQLQAIELLSNGKRSQQSIADEVGVTRRTVVRWLANPEFQAALKGVGTNQFVVNPDVIEPENAIEPEIIQPQKSRFSVRERLNGLIPTIIDETEAILLNPDTRTADKLKSAAMLAKWAGLEDRPDSVEQAFEYLAESKLISMDFIDFYIEGMEAFKEQLFTKLKGRFEDV